MGVQGGLAWALKFWELKAVSECGDPGPCHRKFV